MEYSCCSESKLIRHRCSGLWHAGTEEACGTFLQVQFFCTHIHNFLGVHHPIALRVYALTFLRYT